jgi:hypothetical protein
MADRSTQEIVEPRTIPVIPPGSTPVAPDEPATAADDPDEDSEEFVYGSLVGQLWSQAYKARYPRGVEG